MQDTTSPARQRYDDNAVSYLRVEESKKDEEWYKDVMGRIIPYDNSVTDQYNKRLKIYKLLNNDLDVIKSEIDRYCKPLGGTFSDPMDIDNNIVAYNKLFPKYMYHIGQMLKYGTNFDIMVMGGSAAAAKKTEFMKVKQKSINERIAGAVSAGEMQAEGLTNTQIEQEQNAMMSTPPPEELTLEDYTSEMEIFYSRLLEYFDYKFNLKRMMTMTFKHVMAVDACAVDIVDHFGMPTPVVYNPLHFGSHKSPDKEFFHEGEYFWYKTPITITDAYDELVDKADEETLNRLLGYTGSTNLRPNKKWDVLGPKRGTGPAQADINYTSVEEAYESDQFANKRVGQSMGDDTLRGFPRNRLIWKTYLQFKAYRQLAFMTYVDEYGVEVTEVVPPEYPIPEGTESTTVTNRYGKKVERWEWMDEINQTPVSIEKMYVPRRYHMKRYGSDIYTDMEEIPNQPLSVENPFRFSLSAKGRRFTALNAEGISLLERALPYYIQYLFVKELQSRELAKYEGYIKNIDASMIPDYLVNNDDGTPIYPGADKLAIWRYYRKKLGDSYYDPTQDAAGLPNYQRAAPVKPEIAGNVGEIINLENLADLIERQMGLAMLVPPQGEGQIEPYSTATDNRQSLVQGFSMAEEYYSMHNEVWRHAINEWLSQERVHLMQWFDDHPDQSEHYLNYISSEGGQVALKVTPENLQHEDIGVFLHESAFSNQYRQLMLQQAANGALAQNAAQGASSIISELFLALSRGDSPEQIHKLILMAEQRQQQMMQQQSQQRQMEIQKAMEAKMQEKQMESQAKIQQIEAKGQIDREIKAMDIFKFTQEKDTMGEEGVPDYIEAMLAVREMDTKERNVDLQEQKLEQRERELEMKRRKEE